eukprot:4233710-Pleurochrysis_carterae.AAC.1
MVSTAAPPVSRRSCFAKLARRVDSSAKVAWSRGRTGGQIGVGRRRRCALPSAFRPPAAVERWTGWAKGSCAPFGESWLRLSP